MRRRRRVLTVGELQIIRSGFGAEAVEYQTAWDDQRARHAARVADLVPDAVILLEHPPVYTAGKRTEPADRPFDGTPVVEVDRGGKITWHGPGQLVGYPIVRLPEGVYVVDFVRRVEQAIIEACADLGLHTERVKGRSGVWVPEDEAGRTARSPRSGCASPRTSQCTDSRSIAKRPRLDHRIVPCGIRTPRDNAEPRTRAPGDVRGGGPDHPAPPAPAHRTQGRRHRQGTRHRPPQTLRPVHPDLRKIHTR